MKCPTLIKLTSPFSFSGFSGDIFFIFYSNFNRVFCECNSVETLVRRERLTWVCTVNICPTKYDVLIWVKNRDLVS